MSSAEFTGFGGVVLRADVLGSPNDPPVVLSHSGGQTRKNWSGVAEALVRAGRFVINLDLRGHGESDRPVDGRYDFDAIVEDLKSVLSQLPSRPVIVAASLGGWVATVALGEAHAPLASGLVLVDSPDRFDPETGDRIKSLLKSLESQASNDVSIDWDPRFPEAIDLDQLIPRVLNAGKNISVPTLFIQGEQSSLTSGSTAGPNDLLGAIPGAEQQIVKEAGHEVANDQTDLFNAVLLDFLETRNPRTPPEYIAGSDPATLRKALGCFATGITIVTASTADGTPVGLTANSFTSVSLDPPLLLVCIARNAGTCPVFESAPSFGVNIIHIGQQPTSNLFASKNADRFSQIEWEHGISGAPILMNSLASIECKRQALYDGGDHVILLGKVERARFEPQRDPLLYFGGKYRRLHLG